MSIFFKFCNSHFFVYLIGCCFNAKVLLMKGLFFLSVSLLLITSVYAQVEKVNYRSPLDIDLIVNGTFGELRSNHFHSGIDFSTQRKVGIPVYAIEDGVVNRIKVSSYGYGNVLYIRHPNGYTSVYAHLEAFEEPIATYVKKEQYKQQKFDVELFPLANELNIKRDQIISYTGNTGSSGGPHLHFELRDTSTEEIINPYTLGMFSSIKDTQKPILNGLWVYPANNEVGVQGVFKPIPINYTRMNNGEYKADKVFTNGAIGFGINSYDILENSTGKNGLYEIVLKVNGSVYAHVVFDRFSFDKTRYINHFIDFKKMQEEGQLIQKLFNKNELPIPIFKKIKKEGFLEVAENEDYQVVVEISDFHKNKQVIHIPVSYNYYDVPQTEAPYTTHIDYYRDYAYEEDNLYVQWKAGTFYEDVYLDINLSNNEIFLGKDVIPVHENIDLRINVENMNINKDKAFIARIDGNKIIYNDTWKRDNDFRIRTKNLGKYKIAVDEIPPTVVNKTNKKVTLRDELIFEIQDDLSGIATFSGTINGNWALFTYDYKTKLIKHQLSEGIATKGENILLLEIKDRIGNNVIFEYPFTIP